ncbi:phosphatase PAP2 family protein [Actinomycetaceae bacterium TAE3-ERU4]|nr:phosphatase PAP2 family protein [Actinomycetaceae bacterium TAE3-ERU4]
MQKSKPQITWRTAIGLCLFIFVLVLGQMIHAPRFQHSNQEIWLEFIERRRDSYTIFMQQLTALFNPWNAVFLTILVALAVYFLTKKILPTLYVIVTVSLASLFTHVTKNIIEFTRPPLDSHLVKAASSSFPSGHSTGAAALTFALALVITRFFATKLGRKRKMLIWALAWVFMCSIALSRLYLGVHWFTDVVAGISVGVATGLIFTDLFFSRKNVLNKR